MKELGIRHLPVVEGKRLVVRLRPPGVLKE